MNWPLLLTSVFANLNLSLNPPTHLTDGACGKEDYSWDHTQSWLSDLCLELTRDLTRFYIFKKCGTLTIISHIYIYIHSLHLSTNVYCAPCTWQSLGWKWSCLSYDSLVADEFTKILRYKVSSALSTDNSKRMCLANKHTFEMFSRTRN